MTARRLCHGAARVITGPASGVHSVLSPKSESASGEVSVRSRVNTRNMQRVYIEIGPVHTSTTHPRRPGRPPRRARRPLAPARCRMPPGGDSAPPRRRVRARSRAAAGGPPAAPEGGSRQSTEGGRCGGAGPAAADRIQHLRRHGVRHAMVCGDRSVYGWVVTDHNVSDTPLTRYSYTLARPRVRVWSRVRLVPSLCTLNT